MNSSVGGYPLEMLPKFYHYGYGVPYYNITRIVRTIVFGTRNSRTCSFLFSSFVSWRFLCLLLIVSCTVGLNFGVLLAWVLIGMLNMTAVQWYVRRQDIMALRKASAVKETALDPDCTRVQSQVGPGMEALGSKV